MSNNDSSWVKEASSVLGEDASEEQTSPFQITMPYVVLQIMQRLEPNHSVQVNATGASGLFCDTRLNLLADFIFIPLAFYNTVCFYGSELCYSVNSCIETSLRLQLRHGCLPSVFNKEADVLK